MSVHLSWLLEVRLQLGGSENKWRRAAWKLCRRDKGRNGTVLTGEDVLSDAFVQANLSNVRTRWMELLGVPALGKL